MQGYYTTDIHCVIQSKCVKYIETAVLHKDVNLHTDVDDISSAIAT